jgi:hypothetical protein
MRGMRSLSVLLKICPGLTVWCSDVEICSSAIDVHRQPTAGLNCTVTTVGSSLLAKGVSERRWPTHSR